PPIPVINASTIVRCRRCRTYINPYVQFLDKGQRWKCNLCYFPNDVPESFDVDALHHTVLDRWKRPELNHAVVEFVAPSEYMLRPPQPPTFLFIVDVSMGSVQSGFLRTCCQTLTLSLHQLPNADLRTLVGLITVDASSLHFYQLTSNEDHEKRFNPNDGVQMLVVSDLDDVFLPAPEGVFVNLDECKRSFLHLLSILPDVHASSSSSSSSSSPCQLKPALQAGYQLMQSIGGKITVFLTNNPSPFQIDGLSGASSGFFPSSSLQDKKKNVSSSSSTSSSSSSSSFYKKFAVDCYLCQISVDLFLMEFTTSSLSFPSRNGSSTSMPPPPPSSSSSSSHFPDLPSMICVPKFTAGHVYMYPDFHVASPAHVEKFQREVHHYLGRALGLEAVMRVRASRGLRTTTYHGHFFVRSNDLLALPNVSPDHTYCIEIQLEETLNTAVVCFQTALLHTTAFGERRIRVLTLALPVSNQLNDVVASLDAGALLCCLARKAVERVHESSALDAREAIVNKCCDVLTHFPGSPQLMCPLYLRMFPLLCLGLTKHLALRTLPSSSSTFLDHQTFAMTQLNTCCIESLITQCHPLVYAIHSMYSPSSSSSLGGLEKTRTHDPPPPGGGAWSASTGGPLDDPTYRGNQGQGQGQGQVLPVTSERFERHGMYIVYNGTVICLWISRCVPSELLYALFDVHHFAEVKDGPFLIPVPFQTTEEGEKGEMTDPSSSAPSPDQQALMSSAPSSSFPSTTMDPTPTHLRPPSTYDAAAALVFKKKVFSFIHQLRLRALALSTCWPVCMVVKEESPTELRNVVLRMLIEDRDDMGPSYPQFLANLRDKIMGRHGST
ncbi:COPII subunit, partial [Coelomomyces lativittatus]